MSTAPGNQSVPIAKVSVPKPDDPPSSVRIVSDCTLFYWWPVWAMGFVMAALTFLTSQRMVMVSHDAKYFENAEVRAEGQTLENKSVWASTAHKKVEPKKEGDA